MAVVAVIDDDIDILDASSLILQAKGHTVVTAKNPEEGYDVINIHKPDVIILDVMMDEPDDGFFMAEKLKRQGSTIPIIMYTSVSRALGIDFDRDGDLPVSEFLDKPISPEKLVETVQKFVDA